MHKTLTSQTLVCHKNIQILRLYNTSRQAEKYILFTSQEINTFYKPSKFNP